MIDSLTLQLADHLKSAIEHHGQASFIVSGGNTPKPLYEELSMQHLAWDKVTLCPSDERWVPSDHPDSNHKMISEALHRNEAARALLINLKTDTSFNDAPATLSSKLNQLHKPFNIVLLGMGADGHTASLFPDSNELDHGLTAPHDEPIITVNSASKGPRLSLTLPTLLNTEHLFVMITGEEKRQVIKDIQSSLQENTLPMAHLLKNATCPITLCWSPDA
jgi:6-phosphogluconolactonase